MVARPSRYWQDVRRAHRRRQLEESGHDIRTVEGLGAAVCDRVIQRNKVPPDEQQILLQRTRERLQQVQQNILDDGYEVTDDPDELSETVEIAMLEELQEMRKQTEEEPVSLDDLSPEELATLIDHRAEAGVDVE